MNSSKEIYRAKNKNKVYGHCKPLSCLIIEVITFFSQGGFTIFLHNLLNLKLMEFVSLSVKCVKYSCDIIWIWSTLLTMQLPCITYFTQITWSSHDSPGVATQHPFHCLSLWRSLYAMQLSLYCENQSLHIELNPLLSSPSIVLYLHSSSFFILYQK